MEISGVGFFGKLPALGDFVSRRLPRQFMEPWDQWLQASMRASQDVHGENWLSLFLVSPIWRFALSPGLCGSSAWAGIVMPSVDRVGRYYPMTLAQEIHPDQVADVFCYGSQWFSDLENAALSALSEQFDLEMFDQALLSIRMPSPYLVPVEIPNSEQTVTAAVKPAYRFDLQDLAHTEHVFPGLARLLLNRFAPHYSFWATEGTQYGQASFLCCDGMPPIDAYADFLKGVPENSKLWLCQPHRLHLPDAVNRQTPMPAVFTPLPGSDFNTLWQSFGITEVGNRRKHNEDAMLNAPEQGLWVVADGMGGHQSGDVASQQIVQTLAGIPVNGELTACVRWICDQLQSVNGYLCEIASSMQQGSVIGSTVVGLIARSDQCAAIWAGDSRLYQLRNGQFKQITRDHTLLDELMSAANISREVALQQVGANVITRAVGGQTQLELDVIYFQAEPGDRYLLCSDGLDKEVTDDEMAQWLMTESCQTATQGLIETALSRNGIDNITVIVVQFG